MIGNETMKMHPLDIQKTLDSMVILVDSREQDTEQARARYEAFGCPWERRKLDFGDYTAVFSCLSLENIVHIERKMNLSELCACFTRDRDRFKREFERARQAGAKIYLLIENASWDAAYAGRYRSKMNPAALIASMLAWLARFDCQIIMCKAESSGKLIHDILYREAKEMLENREET